MLANEYVVFAKGSVNDNLENIKTFVNNLDYADPLGSNLGRIHPAVYDYDEDETDKSLLIQLDYKSSLLQFFRGLSHAYEPKRYSTWKNGMSMPCRSAEGFISLTQVAHSTQITFSVYFVPTFNIKFIRKYLLISLAMVIVAIPIVGVLLLLHDIFLFILVLAIFNAVVMPLGFLINFPIGWFYYFIYRNLFKNILIDIQSNLTLA